MVKYALLVVFVGVLGSCEALVPVLDAPVQVVDPVTQEVAEVPVGDVVADNAAPVANTVGQLVGTVNPVLGLMAAGAIGTLLAGARRKKKPTA